jgi:hypothetical protein
MNIEQGMMNFEVMQHVTFKIHHSLFNIRYFITP